ncbi:MAG: hypothetical protein F6K58_01220 [Symploca sp. SIO2E9]|nr:hypothetical protein [Symploca sp. SIO2E9]
MLNRLLLTKAPVLGGHWGDGSGRWGDEFSGLEPPAFGGERGRLFFTSYF